MIQRAFEFLFVLTLVAPPATVIAGVLLLAWPRHHVPGVGHSLPTASHA